MAKESISVRTIDANLLSSGKSPPEIDEQTGLPKQLQAFLVVTDPEVLVIPQFLSDAEMTHMLELAENLWSPSGVTVGHNKQKQVTEARTSYSCIFQPGHTAMIANLEERVANLAGLSVDCLEQLALVRYKPGQFFTTHHDGAQRSKTVFIYLNDLPDEESGGHTVFPKLGVQFSPRRGAAVMWNNIHADGTEDSRLLHAGLAPLKGVKYGVNCFFNCKPLKVRGVIGGDMPVEIPLVNTEAQDRKEWRTIDPVQYLSAQDQGQPEDIKVFVCNTDPKLAVIPNCLSTEEVSTLIRHHQRSSNDAISEEELKIIGRIQTRLAGIAGEPLELLDIFSTSVYRPGVIPDGLSKTGDDEYGKKFGRKAFFIYLDEASENQGGEVRFPRLELQVRPRAGCAVFWSTVTQEGRRSLITAHQPNEIHHGNLHVAFCTFGSGTAAGA